MSNNVFVEEIVKREWKAVDRIKSVCIIIGCILLFTVLIYVLNLVGFASYLGPILLAAAIWFCWLMISNMRIEYEYSVTDGYFVIDKIIARNRRKRVITFETHDIESFEQYNESYEQKSYDTRLMLDDNNDEHTKWCIELTHKDTGRTLVVFSPTERVIVAMKPFLRRQVAFHAFGR